MTLTERPPTPPPRPGFRAILTPGWLGLIALALVFAGASWFVLAPWQYGRHVERQALNNQIESALAATPVPVTDLLTTGAEPADASRFRLVTASGTFVSGEQAYVRLRQQNGFSAAEVVLPFVLTDGTRILVDRGYFSSDELAAGTLPPDVPTGQVTLTGRVSGDQPDPSQRPEEQRAGRREVYGIDSAALLGSTPDARLGFVQLIGSAPGALAEIGVPDRDGGPFLSYALQWVVFGAVALLAAGVFAYREVMEPIEEPGGSAESAESAGSAGSAESPESAETEQPVANATSRKAPKPGKFDKSSLYD
ncbi:MAG: SURF1 family cytochrome oxidase biogenesis protein [Nakamurella sp.]